MILTRRDPSRVNREKRLDVLWQKVVKTRDNFTCQRCGSRGKVDAAHAITRSRKLTRWEIANGVTLCTGHHLFFHRNPVAFSEWWNARAAHNGTPSYDELRAWSQPGRTKLDLDMVATQLKARARVYGIHA